MTFTSVTFAVFFTLVFTAYWTLRRRTFQNVLLLAVSYFFYGWWDWRFCGLMALSSAIDYGCSLALDRTERPAARKAWLVLSLATNLGLLGFFKYFNFFADSLQAMTDSIGWTLHPVTLRIVLPVGISFYTFQTLSYTIDVYRREIRATKNFVDFFAFVSFFPQLVAGPIERASALLPQFEQPRSFNAGDATDGSRQMLWGVFKKMVLADNLAGVVDPVFASWHQQPGPMLALATVCFAFQIYCDFSAYSDIAQGSAKLLGIRLMRNFAYPYFSQSVAEFWRRWHISLSTWFRDYVYLPLGGGHVSRARRLANVLATFLLSGLWHGAAWQFVAWGGVNGVAMMPTIRGKRSGARQAEQTPGGDQLIPRFTVLWRMGMTFTLICLAWVFFRAASLSQALSILGRMAHDAVQPAAYKLAAATVYWTPGLPATLILLAGFVLVEWLQRRKLHVLDLAAWPRLARWSIYTMLFWSLFLLSPAKSGQFIYCQF
ncbi:MAG: MBOAT family protein [Phycisphaeraceae bacterium]|nr:MBOAT family protein [Phycisphaeraceae bacterium]